MLATASINATPVALPLPLPGNLLLVVPDHDPFMRARTQILESQGKYAPDIAAMLEARGQASPASFRPPAAVTPRTAPVNSLTRLGNTTFGEALRQYGQAVWQARQGVQDAGARYAQTRREALQSVGGRRSPQGAEVAKYFSGLHKYLNELASARDQTIRQHPEHAGIVRDAADTLKNTALGSFAHGIPAGDARALLRYYVQPRIDAAIQLSAAARQALEHNRQQVRDITLFWRIHDFSPERAVAYLAHGRMVFDSEEELEKYCPAGIRTTRPDPQGNPVPALAYEGATLQTAFVRQPDGSPRQVHFEGSRWMYADQMTPADWLPGAGQPEPADRRWHRNSHWNPDPEVQQARANGSAIAMPAWSRN